MLVRQRHRHVEVVGSGSKRALEDRHDEPRIDSVEDMSCTMLSRQGGDIVGGGCIDTGSDETSIAELVDDTLRTRKVVVRDYVPREEVAPGGDLRSCRAHSSEPTMRTVSVVAAMDPPQRW